MTKKNFKDLINNETSKVHERIAYLKANRAWLKTSMRIAVTILKNLRERKITQVEFAIKLNVTPQYVNKILKGHENLTLETIARIESILEISLIKVESYQYQGESVKSSSTSFPFDKPNYKKIATEAKLEVRDTFEYKTENENNFALAA
ncbi:MAG: helix-turn-helix transcriptional regulator [Bacteroidia bacterium]|nr:helix-turn-helix transcriptional regulator [Bacteroidia bacterium]MBP9689809.1 helix-turn-helix transcriptional regulator [Bacteroidia bacterium]